MAVSKSGLASWLRVGNIFFGVLFFASIIFQSKIAYAASMVFFTLGIVCFELRRRLERQDAASGEGDTEREADGEADHQSGEPSG